MIQTYQENLAHENHVFSVGNKKIQEKICKIKMPKKRKFYK